MCECTRGQADAWMAVWDALTKGNNGMVDGRRTGQDCALDEIKRLQDLAKRTTLTEATLLSVRHERDGESANKNLALRELDKEREKHTETLKLLERERETSDQLGRELVKSRDELAQALSPLPPVMGDGAQKHQQNVRQVIRKYARFGTASSNCSALLAEAVHYLLDRDRLQTAAIKRLTRLAERLEALDKDVKQPAYERPRAPWEMQPPSGGFNLR